jgi:hypothetical protein
LKLKCDEPLSNFGFKFDLRRHSKVELSARSSLFQLVLTWEALRLGLGGRVRRIMLE